MAADPAPADAAPDAPAASAERVLLERAFLERPSFGIRLRLVLSFMLVVVLALATTIGAWVLLAGLERRLGFLEVADRYAIEIEQMRRFEKNYLLYGSGLAEVRDHLERARRLLADAAPDARVVSARELERMNGHLARYEELVGRLAAAQSGARPMAGPERSGVEAELRDHGSQAVAFAMALAERERTRVNARLALVRRLPIVLLLFLVVFSVIGANFLSRQIVGPIGRLMASTGRIARGDFTPLMPQRWYRDELSNFALALNAMMRELAHRQDVLVQSHKLSAVGTLTAGVAHELNNPINNIVLTAEMLKEDYTTLDDQQRLDMVEDLVGQASRAQKIVRNLLDFAREREISTERLDLAEVLRDATSLAANHIRVAGARISVDVSDNLPAVYGDKQSLSQVFVNLLLNALDAVGKGGRVRVSASAEHDQGWVRVVVADDGKGIPPHVLPHVFDPFFTTKEPGKGTGLGLSVSLGIARQHGGDIRAESVPGKGTTMTVLLPAAQVPAGGREAQSGPSDSSLARPG